MSKKIEEIFKAIGTPKYIQFLELEDKGNKIQKMPVGEFITLARTKGNSIESWTESVDFGGYDNSGPVDSTLDEKSFKKLLLQAKANLSKLAICYMGPKLDFSVIATQDIGIGEIIGLYTGVIKPAIAIDREKYKLNPTIQSYKMHCTAGKRSQNSFQVDAYQNGNITRFIQHAFSPAELKTYFDEYGETVQYPSSIAIANVRQYSFSFEKRNFVVLKTISSIKKGRMVFYNYSLSYWEEINIRPESFTPSGTVIPSLPEKREYSIVVSPTGKIFDMAEGLGYEGAHSAVISHDMKYIKSCLNGENRLPFKGEDEGKILFEVGHDLYKQSLLQSNLDTCLRIYIKTPMYPLDDASFGTCLKMVLNHQTGIEWKYSRAEKIAFTNVNQTVYEYLKNHGFNISIESREKGLKFLFLYLKEISDQEKLTEIPKLVKDPEEKSAQTDLFKSKSKNTYEQATPVSRSPTPSSS